MATPPLLKDLNERTVLETIRVGAPISRAQISRRSGISKPTVSLALQALLEAGLVRQAEAGPGGPSYGAVYFEAAPDAALVVGLDLGTRFLRGAVCDLGGGIRARRDVELRRADVDVALDAAVELTESLVAETESAIDRVNGVVVGVPGVVEANTGRVNLATNVPGLEERAFADELRARLGVPVTLENDINLAALGEHWRGVARGVDDFVFLFVGTGFGAGVVLGGEVHRGHHGAAGEVDYAFAGLDTETDPSAEAVAQLAGRLAASSETMLKPPYEAADVFAAARGGDTVAGEVVGEIARRIALHVAPIAAVADVGLVVLGGRIGANGDLLLEPVRTRLASWLPYPPRVEVSSLGEAAILTGALAVGLRSALDNVFENRAVARA